MKDTIYFRKQFPTRGRTVAQDNMAEVARWCGGEVQVEGNRHFIWVPVENARLRTQREANIGDTILKSRREDRRRGGDRYIFKIYRPEWLEKEFDKADPDIIAFLREDDDAGVRTTAEMPHRGS